MRWITAFLGVPLGVALLLLPIAWWVAPPRARLAATNVLLPGRASVDLDDVDPEVREDVRVVLAELRAQGFRPRIAATHRDRARQDFVFDLGRLVERLGGGPSTRARGGLSCHNFAPSLAVDVVPGPHRESLAAQAVFYRALGRAAKKRGLEWGGDWSRRNRAWKRYGLGWDPAHLEARRC